MSEFLAPERSMLYVYIAMTFKCPNTDKDCLLCPYSGFCILLKEYLKYMSDNYPELIKKFEAILKDDTPTTTGSCGKWEIQYFDNTPKFFICSNCKCRLSYRYNFCPCCGSDNRG